MKTITVEIPDTVSIIDLLQFAHSHGLELRHDNEHKKSMIEPGNVRSFPRRFKAQPGKPFTPSPNNAA